MPLLEIWKSSPDAITKMSLEQVVHISGNGKLTDNSTTSEELRLYFSEIDTVKLDEYVNYCLANSFSQSGLVLQDIVNELGKRLEYNVVNGLYSGTKNAIGFDGIWVSPENNSIVVEVKTTDAYRINLDTIANYRNKLIKNNTITDNSSILIVVGRQDTGDIEAQIRGSRHAWTIRMISAESLLKIVTLKESSEDEVTLNKIRSLLIPFEYTRLDNIIDIMFTTAADASTSETIEAPIEIEEQSKPQYKQNKTDLGILKGIRNSIIASFNNNKSVKLIAKSKALFWSGDKKFRVVCTISKLYEKNMMYWYAYHDSWKMFLEDCDQGYYIIGFIDTNKYVALPREILNNYFEKFNKSTQDGKVYWHIHIIKADNQFQLRIPNSDPVSLSDFTYEIN